MAGRARPHGPQADVNPHLPCPPAGTRRREVIGANLAKHPSLEMLTSIEALAGFSAPTTPREPVRTRSVEMSRPVKRRADFPGEGDPGAVGRAQILVPVDFSDGSLRALNFAGGLARQFGAAIGLLHVVMPLRPADRLAGRGRDPGQRQREALARIREWEAVAVSRCRRAGAAVAAGRPAAEIVAAAEKQGVGLVVLAARDRNWLGRLLCDGTAAAVVEESTRPVLVVPEKLLAEGAAGMSPGTSSVWNNLLVPVGGAEGWQAALRYAGAWATTMKSRLTVFRVLSPGGSGRRGNPFSASHLSEDAELAAVARREAGEGIEVQILREQGMADAEVILKAAAAAGSEMVVLTLDEGGRQIASDLVRANRCALLAAPGPLSGEGTNRP